MYEEKISHGEEKLKKIGKEETEDPSEQVIISLSIIVQVLFHFALSALKCKKPVPHLIIY